MDLKGNLTLYSTPAPGSGVLTAYILNILEGMLDINSTASGSKDPLHYHRIAEAFKHAYAQRTKLADPDFEPQVVEVKVSKILKPIKTEGDSLKF